MRVFKRGDRWYYEIYENGKRIRKSLGPEMLSEMGAVAEADRVTALALGEYIEDYLRGIFAQVSGLTIASYRKSLYKFSDFLGSGKALDEITGRDISAFASDRLRSGVKPETVNIDLRQIRAAFNKAVHWELLEKPPRIEFLKVKKRLPSHLTVDQVAAILEAEPDPDFKRLWTFLVWMGCRRGEALGLAWEHITLGERPEALITGKGDRERVIPLLPPAVAALGPVGSGLVFPPWRPHSVSQHFRRLVRSLGLKARVHDLRHTCLTWLVAKGVPLKLVQDIAGHSSINTTMLYAKVYTGESYDTLTAAFGFKPG